MRLALGLTLAITVAGCGTVRESRLNPFNWFGQATTAPAAEFVPGEPAPDGRLPVDQLTRMELKKTPGGAILSVAGLPPTQGWWNAELVAEDKYEKPVDGVLTYRFVVAEPQGQTRSSTPQSRELTAARFISDQKLDGVRQIVVLAARNQMASKR